MKKKPVKLKKLIINRAKWARGGKNGSAALLNSAGNMCCLGFACARLGFTKDQLADEGEPLSLAESLEDVEKIRKLGGLVTIVTDESWDDEDEEIHTYDNSKWSSEAIYINDDDSISDKMREYRLKPILRRAGFDVKFVGPTDVD